MRQILNMVLTIVFLSMSVAAYAVPGQVREDRMYRIVSPAGLAIDNRMNPDNLGNLFLSPADRKNRGQLWRLVSYGDAYVIYSPFTNKSFDVVNAGGEDTPLGTWDFSRANVNQHFIVTFNDDGSIALSHQNSGRALSLTGEDSAGARVFLMEKGKAPLRWMLEPAKDKLPPENLRGRHEWENEQISGVNKLPGHVTRIPYPDVESMRGDGYYSRPWEMLGYGTPIYTNVTYPFKNAPSLILPQKGYTNETETNPVGSYRREFTLPEEWADQQVFLHFDGVYSGFYVWINGKKVGYSEGANNDAEFNVTEYVRPGTNTLAVEVYRWTDGIVDVSASFTKPSGTEVIRRMGIGLAMRPGYENVRWYGRGPHESYADRCRSAAVGIYEDSVDGFASEHYVRAQSMGNREDARWFEITDGSGSGLRMELLSGGMSFSVMHYTDADLWNIAHDYRLPEIRRDETIVNIDVIQQGLGNATCGPAPLDEYMIPEDRPLEYSFRLSYIE